MKLGLALAFATALLLQGPIPARAALHAGDPAPDFQKTDLNGVTHTLSQYRGKVVVLFLLGYG